MNNEINGIPTVDLDQTKALDQRKTLNQTETVTLRELANIFRLRESATVKKKLQERGIAVTQQGEVKKKEILDLLKISTLPDQFITLEETSKELKLSEAVIKNFVKTGMLRGYQFPNRHIFLEEDLQKFKQEHKELYSEDYLSRGIFEAKYGLSSHQMTKLRDNGTLTPIIFQKKEYYSQEEYKKYKEQEK